MLYSLRLESERLELHELLGNHESPVRSKKRKVSQQRETTKMT